jgi:dimethylamine monooxygenase subunit A
MKAPQGAFLLAASLRRATAMPFDFDLANVAVPFRMQPGLRKLPSGAAQLTPLEPGSRLHAEKRAVLEAGASRQVVEGFDVQPALCAIARHAAFEGPPELAFEEDFAVLDGATGRLMWLCVCVPSHWAPEEKIGLPLAAVHAPVADNALLVSASQQLAQLVTGDDAYERFVWTVTPSPRYDQHPKRHAREVWPVQLDDDAFFDRCWLRAERQTFIPLGGGTRQAVFTIRVMLQPLADVLDTPGKARHLHDSLASMSDAVLAYKGLAAARDPLLRALAKRSA